MISIRNAERPSRIRVKFMAKEFGRGELATFARQLPSETQSWGNCQFIFDPDARDYDWLVCYDDLAPANGERFSSRIESLACPREHTLFITVEPSSIKVYGNDFLRQFGLILTSQEQWAIGVEHAIYSQPALRWYYGAGKENLKSLEELQEEVPLRKTADLSTVCSNKKHNCTLHARRVEFTEALAKKLPSMELFGRGVRPIDDKADAVSPYRYHLAIENHIAPHHWTEKLSDVFLGASLPFYVGCPNAADYFPPDSFIPLPIDDVHESARIIREAIAADEYRRRLPAVLEARNRVLNQYNLFAVVANLIQRHHQPGLCSSGLELLFSRHALRKQSVSVAFRFALERFRTRGASRRLVRQFVEEIHANERTTDVGSGQ